MRIKVVADSTCDLSQELIDKYQIEIIPLYVTLDDKSYLDSIEIHAADIFRHVSAGGALPKTSAIPVATYAEVFERLLKEHDALICLTIGSKFSSCYQNACIAANYNPRISIVDSKNLSTGFGHVVLQTAIRARTDMTHAMIADLMELDVIPKVDASFIVDRLDYLHKGGRCSTIAALGANLLKLKPCIAVQNGEMRVVKKYRGSFTNCVSQYVKDRLTESDRIRKDRIFITYTQAEEEALQAARDGVQAAGSFDEVAETVAGCTVSSHCGPNTLGVLFIYK